MVDGDVDGALVPAGKNVQYLQFFCVWIDFVLVVVGFFVKETKVVLVVLLLNWTIPFQWN